MSVSGSDFLEWAEAAQSAGICGEEIDARNCASRAYYASYHFVKWLGDQLPIAPSHVIGSHAKLCYQLINSRRHGDSAEDVKTIRKLGYILNLQRDTRVRADYHVSDDFLLDDSQQAIKHAAQMREIVGKLDDCAA